MKKVIFLLFIYVSVFFMSFSCEDSLQLNECQKLNHKLLGNVDSLQTEIFKYKGKQIDTIKIIETVIKPIYDTLILFDTIYISDTINAEIPLFTLEIKPDSVLVDSISYSFLANNLVDGIPFVSRDNSGTRWALKGYPHIAVFRFNEVVKIDSIEINTFAWNEGYTHTFKVYNFSDLLLESETKPEKYSGHKINFIGTQLYIEFTGGKNSWCDIGEIKLYKKDYRL